MTENERLLLAEDIISYYMVELESRYEDAVDHDRFFSVIMLNKCRDFFSMPHAEPINKRPVRTSG